MKCRGDFEEQSPNKKSKLQVFSGSHKSDEQEVEKMTKDKTKTDKITNKVNVPNERFTRRKATAAVTSTNKKFDEKKANPANVRKDKNLAGKQPIQKHATSNIPTRINKLRNRREISNPQKKAEPRTESSTKTSQPKQPPKSNKDVHKSSQQNANEKTDAPTSGSSSRISSRTTTPKSTPNVSPIRKQNSLSRAKKSLLTSDSSSRLRSTASEPQIGKANSRIVMKKVTSPTKQKDMAAKMALSLTNLDSSKHRTRHAITKEFMANNVMTRNRSIDGKKLLEKIDTLTSIRRKSSIGVDMTNEKSLETSQSRKIVEGKSTTSIRPRRLKSLDRK